MSTIQERLRSGHTNGTTWEAQSREASNVIDGLVEALKQINRRAKYAPQDDVNEAKRQLSHITVIVNRILASTKCEEES